MINTQSLLLPRTFAFAARDAARRLVHGRLKQRRRRYSWRPAVLQWRQRPKRLVDMASVQSHPRAMLPSSLQVHLHWTTHFSGRIGNHRHASTASIHHTRLVLQHIGSGVRAAAPVQRFPRTSYPSRAHAVHMRFQLHMHGGLSTLVGSSGPSAKDPTVSWTAARLKPLFVGRSVEGRHPSNATREPQQQLFQPMSARHLSLYVVCSRGRNRAGFNSQRTFPSWHLPSPSLGAKELPRHYKPQLATVIAKQRDRNRREAHPEEPRVYKGVRLPSQLGAPEALVWRRGSRSPVIVPESETYQKLTDSRQSREEHAVATQAKALAVSPTTAQPATMHAAKLDASLMDRLTDDVIRRVEQRMRIERQRRGL